MATPFTLSAACAAGAFVAEDDAKSSRLWAAAGALSLLAVAIKPSAWPVGFVFALLLGRDVHARRLRRAVFGVLAGAAGAAAIALVMASPYLFSGRLGALLEGIDAISRFGSASAASTG